MCLSNYHVGKFFHFYEIRNPWCAITVSIYFMQMRGNLLCSQVCVIIQNLSWNADKSKKLRQFHFLHDKMEFQRKHAAPILFTGQSNIRLM